MNEWFGEYVEYENEQEKEEAKIYLKLWKKFFLKKLPSTWKLDEDSEKYIEIPNCSDFYPFQRQSLGLKFKMVLNPEIEQKPE